MNCRPRDEDDIGRSPRFVPGWWMTPALITSVVLLAAVMFFGGGR